MDYVNNRDNMAVKKSPKIFSPQPGFFGRFYPLVYNCLIKQSETGGNRLPDLVKKVIPISRVFIPKQIRLYAGFVHKDEKDWILSPDFL